MQHISKKQSFQITILFVARVMPACRAFSFNCFLYHPYITYRVSRAYIRARKGNESEKGDTGKQKGKGQVCVDTRHSTARRRLCFCLHPTLLARIFLLYYPPLCPLYRFTIEAT